MAFDYYVACKRKTITKETTKHEKGKIKKKKSPKTTYRNILAAALPFTLGHNRF